METIAPEIQRILIPTDYSETADLALAWAIVLHIRACCPCLAAFSMSSERTAPSTRSRRDNSSSARRRDARVSTRDEIQRVAMAIASISAGTK